MKYFILLFFFMLSGSHSVANEGPTILFIGDSLTQGYGVEKEEAYPKVFEQMANAKRDKKIKVINGSISGSTSASGASRMRWFLKSNPDWMILALGANDGLRGLKIDKTKENLEQVIVKAQKADIKVVLAGMLLPTNYGKDYRDEFEKMFQDLAKKYELKLIPFLLKDVAMVKELNQGDGIHPNAKGHQKMAENLWEILGPAL